MFQTRWRYFTHPEDLPKLNPEAFKQINVKETKGNIIVYDMQAEMMGRKLNMTARQTLDT